MARKQICINWSRGLCSLIPPKQPQSLHFLYCSIPAVKPRRADRLPLLVSYTCNTKPATDSDFKAISHLLVRHVKSSSSFLPLQTSISVYHRYLILQSTRQFRVSLPGPRALTVKFREKLSTLLLWAAPPLCRLQKVSFLKVLWWVMSIVHPWISHKTSCHAPPSG